MSDRFLPVEHNLTYAGGGCAADASALERPPLLSPRQRWPFSLGIFGRSAIGVVRFTKLRVEHLYDFDCVVETNPPRLDRTAGISLPRLRGTLGAVQDSGWCGAVPVRVDSPRGVLQVLWHDVLRTTSDAAVSPRGSRRAAGRMRLGRANRGPLQSPAVRQEFQCQQHDQRQGDVPQAHQHIAPHPQRVEFL